VADSGGRQQLGEELRACDRQPLRLPAFVPAPAPLPPAAVAEVAESHRRAALVLPAGHPPEVELAPGLGWLAESEGRSGRSGGRCDVAGGDMPGSGAGGA
jgi:hypothetical protein